MVAKAKQIELSQDIRTRLIEAFRAGAFREHAAYLAGLTVLELEAWLAEGELGREPYATLLRDINHAIADDALRNQIVVTRAAAGQPTQGDWRAAAWNLERKYPRLYGRAAGSAAALDEKPHSPYAKQ
jgi:hypothetical protein